MRIRNTTAGTIIISDLPNQQGGSGVYIPSGVEIVIFNEDAEKSTQLGSLIDSGGLSVLGNEEPNDGGSQSSANPVIVGPIPNIEVTTQPTPGQVLTAIDATHAHWTAGGTGGLSVVSHDGTLSGDGTVGDPLSVVGSGAADASTAVKGISKLSAAPASPTNPIAVGDNDARMTNARTPVSHGLSGAEHSASTLADLNLKITGEQIVGASDSRLTDSRAPNGSASGDLSGSFPSPTVAKVNGVAVSGTPTSGQTIVAANGTTASWQTPSGGGIPPSILSAKGSLISATSAGVAADLPIGSGYLVADSMEPTGMKWASIPADATKIDKAVLTARGTLITRDAMDSTPRSLPAGTNGQVLTANSAAPGDLGVEWQTPGAAADASTTVKGVTKLSTAPASPTDPIAVGDNDTRMTNSRAPNGSASGDLSGTFPSPTVAKVNGVTVSGTPTSGQVIMASNGTTAAWATPSGGGPASDYNAVSLYQVETTSGQTAWVKSSSSIRTGLSWSRVTTVLTINDVGHGRTAGERVIVRGANLDYQVAVVATTPDLDSFTIATADSGASSGSAAAYSMGFTFAHNAAAGSITTGTLTAPANANVQLISLRVYLAASTRSTTTYDVILPASATNGAGGDTGENDLFVPLCAVRQHPSGSDGLMTSVGFTLTKAVGGNFGRFQLAALGATGTPINIMMQF